MGGKSCKAVETGKRAITIAVLGLDNAGKTTTKLALTKEPNQDVTPTVGYSESELVHKNERIKLIDLGGAHTFREAWRHYYPDAYGFVYVLDSSEPTRLAENREVLRRLLKEEKVKGKPILILANKQDKTEAMDRNQILVDLQIERTVNESETLCRVELCTAKFLSTDPKKAKVDESIRNGFDWLIKVIFENYPLLHSRVEKDVQERSEAEKKEKLERKARIEKLRMEREMAEGVSNNDEENEDTIKAGFVPINQAVKNAERNIQDKSKTSEIKNEKSDYRPIPAPRSSSQNRKVTPDLTNQEERPRRASADLSPRPQSSSRVSRFDDEVSNHSNDEQAPVKSTVVKKKKVLGPIRQRGDGDSLPPLAPSSAASRREEFSVSKGPQVGTPRPSAPVAPWAITSHTIPSNAEQLTTIASDNELDVDDDRQKSQRSSKRITSPHSNTVDRSTVDKGSSMKNIDDENPPSYRTRSSSRQKQLSQRDPVDDGINSQRSRPSSAKKLSSSRFDNEDSSDDQRRTAPHSSEPNRSTKPRQIKNRSDENDDGLDKKNRQAPSSSRRVNESGNVSARSHRYDDKDDAE